MWFSATRTRWGLKRSLRPYRRLGARIKNGREREGRGRREIEERK